MYAKKHTTATANKPKLSTVAMVVIQFIAAR
jgi:hypothetical protein